MRLGRTFGVGTTAAAVCASSVLALSSQSVAAETIDPTASGPSTVGVARGDMPITRGVFVRHVTVSKNARKISAQINWDAGLIRRKGGQDRFSVRLVGFPTSSNVSTTLYSRTYKGAANRPLTLNIALSAENAQLLTSSEDVVLTASQGHKKQRHDSKYSLNFVSTKHLDVTKRGSRVTTTPIAAVARSQRSCRSVLIRSGTDLSNCDLRGGDLKNFTLSESSVDSAALAGVVLDGSSTSQLTGTPRSLPVGWYLRNGSFTQTPPPSPPLTCANGGSCQVGDTGPGGGTVFYAAASRQDWGQYLEVAPPGWMPATNSPNYGRPDGVSNIDPRASWGQMHVDMGVYGQDIGDGKPNTEVLVASPFIAPADAGKLAAGYSSGTGVNDWFLPSPDELNQLCRYARQQDTTLTTPCDSTGSLRSDFPSQEPMWYWSSSENSSYAPSYLAMGICFADGPEWCQAGAESAGSKDSLDRSVRPIREF